jgi:Leucine-rich repeat (LRR) protein
LPPLPSTLEKLECFRNNITCLPPLPSTLKILVCFDNQLMCLPNLPPVLETLSCYNNHLTYLPPLPSTLKELYCFNNQLTCLPPLSSNLKMLNCFNNQLTYLPLLPSTLKDLFCGDNLFLDYYVKQDKLSMAEYITKLQKQIKITNQFRELFYSLKYKKQLQDLLWFHIREPKIRNRYHPNNLMTMLEGREDITMDELDELLEKW